MLTNVAVRKAMLAKAADSLLDEADVKKLKFRPYTATESKELKLPASAAGFTLPYFDITGKVTKFFRYRYMEDTRKGFAALGKMKTLRYGQPAQSVNEIYLAPFVDWRALVENADIPLLITEGELKAACVTKMGVPTIGLGGVWCFMSKRNGTSLLPQLQSIKWKDRKVIICYDSDAVTNPDVVHAEVVLAQRLTERGALVLIARLPQLEGSKKQGLDDYLLAHTFEQLQSDVLAKAIEFKQASALHEMSSHVVYIRNPGLIYDYDHQMRMTPAAFVQHAFSNLWYDATSITANGEIRMTRKLVSKAWLEWEHRAELGGLAYEPGQPRITDRQELNLWKGWAAEPKKGDVKPWAALLDHLFEEKQADRQWFERWCAYPLQNPGVKMATAAVVWGVGQGTGKTLVGHTLMRIYGENSIEVKDSDLEDARFEWAENKQFVLGDDISGHDNRKLSRKFMTMITQKQMRLNPKYVPSYTVRDCINYYFTSNDPDAFFMEDHDRRFFIHEVMAQTMPEELRRMYVAWMKSDEGIAALFYYLLTLDLGDFDPQTEAPRTTAKKEMQLMSKSELGVWVARLREDPENLLNGKLKGDLFTAEELHMIFDPLGTKRASANALSREMKRAGFVRPVNGAPLRTAQGFRRLFAVKNSEQWRRADRSAAREHFDTHRQLIKPKF